LGILKEQKHKTYLDIFRAPDLSCLTTQRNSRELGQGLAHVGFYMQAQTIKKFKWVPELAQVIILSHTGSGDLQLNLASSSGLMQSLEAFACASKDDELGKVCRRSRPDSSVE